MGQDPSQIRQDIEQTRERMGDTVEALGHKTDVTRAGEGGHLRQGGLGPLEGRRAPLPTAGR